MKYKISQVAKLSGLTPRQIRQLEDNGLISPARQRHGDFSYRIFTARQAALLIAIGEIRSVIRLRRTQIKRLAELLDSRERVSGWIPTVNEVSAADYLSS